MKAAVSYLEPFMEKVDGESKGRIVLATVKGDVHDIGKNLVDIILSNNGYTVHNLGIKQPITSILDEAKRREAHAVGLSGLLVKSTVVMKESLEEMERQGVRLPVLLGGAALTRRYVEIDCRRVYEGRVEYGKDAFEALSLMESVMGADVERPSRYPGGRGYDTRRGAGEGDAAEEERVAPADAATAPARLEAASGEREEPPIPSRFDRPFEEASEALLPSKAEVRRDIPVPKAPFLGARVVERIALDAVLPYINENVLFKFQWQFKQKKMAKEDYERFIDREVRPIYRDLVRRSKEERILEPRAVYGYFECQSDGDDVLVHRPGTSDVLHRFRFPRQKKHKRLCIADFFRPAGSAEKDLIAFTVVTVGARASDVERQWFAENRYRDYLYLHGLSVESAEALAEFIHRQIRVELEIAGDDSREITGLFRQGYRGSRYSFGYPACPRLEDQEPLLEILDAKRIGVTLSDEFMLEPEQSTSALIVHHPQAKYFNA
jgi:5-methyltetrahydrofolate--homocysteine methyltransferase